MASCMAIVSAFSFFGRFNRTVAMAPWRVNTTSSNPPLLSTSAIARPQQGWNFFDGFCDVYARGLERIDLGLVRSLAADDHRAGMADAASRRDRTSGDKGNDRLAHV